jgi:hypothetical protein
MVLNFQPGPNWGGCAVPTNQGDFVRLGVESGAMLGNMVGAWRAEFSIKTRFANLCVLRLIEGDRPVPRASAQCKHSTLEEKHVEP